MANWESSRKVYSRAIEACQQLLGFCTRFDDDILLILCLIYAKPSVSSLILGLGFICSGMGLIFWMRGFQFPRDKFFLVGPYRFVRFPRRLALWLIALGASLAASSFIALVWSLAMLPWFLDRDERHHIGDAPNLGHRRYERHVPKLLPTLIPYSEGNARGELPFLWRKALLSPGFMRKDSLIVLGYLASCLSICTYFDLPWWTSSAMAGAWLILRLIFRNHGFPQQQRTLNG